MNTLSFPLGPFTPEDCPTPDTRAACIADIVSLPGDLRASLTGLTDEQLLVPYRPGGWTVKQVVHHMADNDMNAYIRFKRGLTEEAPIAGSYRQDVWAELADYRDTRIDTSLLLMEALHERFVILLRSLAPADFARTVTSPTHGDMTLEIAMQRYAWHNRHHLAQIQSLIDRMGWII